MTCFTEHQVMSYYTTIINCVDILTQWSIEVVQLSFYCYLLKVLPTQISYSLRLMSS